MSLPVADARRVRAAAVQLVRGHAYGLGLVLALHAAAAVCGLVGPWVIGRLIDRISSGHATPPVVDGFVGVLVASLVVQGLATRFAQQRAMVLGETVFAALREQFMRTATRLPLSTIEHAGTADLLSRTTNDIESVATTVRFGVPRILIATITAVLTLVAAAVEGPLLAPAMLVGVPLLILSTRWYLRRARGAYRRQLASFATLSGAINETVEGARTVEALSLAPLQRQRIDAALAERRESEWRTLRLRARWFPATTLSFLLPVVVIVGWGIYLHTRGVVTPGQVTTVALYAMQLTVPVDELINWMYEIQVGSTALSRIMGVAEVPPDRTPGDRRPDGGEIEVRDVRYAYRPGHDVLHDISLTIRPGERLAVVGPSGSGKSTLSRLLAGIDAPTHGSVTMGGVPLVELPLAELRRRVALVTQEQHVFIGTLAENLRLAAPSATDGELERALRIVGAWRWVTATPDGLFTRLGSGAMVPTPAQAQQLALARLVLLDPEVLVLDEATSMLDPTAARDLEGALSHLLAGRTVISIAHRLHTAHDADRVALLVDGRIEEMGSHDRLIAAAGEYARLWRSGQAER
jgi:ABC-type multidrug transport system fused ATPase/permease subunit